MAEMGCYEHPDRTVVATCPKCGKFMCKECSEKYESKLCSTCESERIANAKAKLNGEISDVKKKAQTDLIKAIILSGVFAIIGFALGSSSGDGLGFAYILAGFPWGWSFISKIMDDGVMFLAALGNNFLVALIIKLILGGVIGAFTWPFILAYKIYVFVRANNLAKGV